MKFLVRQIETKKVMTKPTSSQQANEICKTMNEMAKADNYEVIPVSTTFAELSSEPREMSADELRAIELLKNIKYARETNHADFANSLLDLAGRAEKEISEKQSVFLWHLIFNYRRQIDDERIIQIAKNNKVY